MEDKEYIYLRFPVQILRADFYNIKQVCSDAISYGVMEYMERKDYKDVKGIIRAFSDLKMAYGGFNRADYSDQPLKAIDHIEELHYSKCYHKNKERYEELKDSIDTPITCSIKKDLIIEFLNKPQKEFSILIFRFIIAMDSIKGGKDFGQGSWDRFFAVMFGYNTDKDLEIDGVKMELLTEAEKAIYLKYSTKRMKENIVETLEISWHLKWVSAGKDGIFFSYKLGYKALETKKKLLRIERKAKKERRLNAKKKGKEDADKELKNKGLA